MAPREHKEGGVNKLIIIAACPAIQELHFNLALILEELNLEAVDFTITGDIKIGEEF